MILGYLALICFMLLCLYQFPQIKKIRGMDKVHNVLGVILFVLIFLHVIQVRPVIGNRSFLVTASGKAASVLVVLVIATALLRKKIKNFKRIHRIGSYVTLVLVLLHIVLYFCDFIQYQNDVKSIHIADADIQTVADGSYIGEYDAGYIYARVEVMVEAGKITDIQLLEHQNERGAKAERITDAIIEEQKIDVDAVSGATNSSLVIKKAVENALKGE